MDRGLQLDTKRRNFGIFCQNDPFTYVKFTVYLT